MTDMRSVVMIQVLHWSVKCKVLWEFGLHIWVLKLSGRCLRRLVYLFLLSNLTLFLTLPDLDNLHSLQLDPPHHPFNSLDKPLHAHVQSDPHIHGQIDPNYPNDEPSGLVPHLDARVKEAREHEAWVGHCQDASLVEDLLEVGHSLEEGLVVEKVPEEAQRLEEEKVHLEKGPVGQKDRWEGEKETAEKEENEVERVLRLWGLLRGIEGAKGFERVVGAEGVKVVEKEVGDKEWEGKIEEKGA